MKTEFMQNISHELRTPLSNMRNYAIDTLHELDREQLNIPEMVFDQTRIKDESERLERMVNQLLDATAIEGGQVKLKKEQFSLGALLSAMADANAALVRENGNRISIVAPEGLPDIDSDPDAVCEVVLNLLSNAARHTKQGVITITLADKGEFQEVRVTDTGEGISPEIMRQVFLKYVERESRVTGRSGLGLYMCKKLIDALGGEIGIESEEGKGASVWFCLPTITKAGDMI
jgi:signal transduction histidine kinase